MPPIKRRFLFRGGKTIPLSTLSLKQNEKDILINFGKGMPVSEIAKQTGQLPQPVEDFVVNFFWPSGVRPNFAGVERAIQGLNRGEPFEEIYKTSGVSRRVIRQLNGFFGIRNPEETEQIRMQASAMHRIPEKLKQQVLDMAKEGFTVTAIRKETHLDWQTIRRILIEHRARSRAEIQRIGHRATAQARLRLSVKEQRQMRALLCVRDPAIALGFQEIARIFRVGHDIPESMNERERIRSREQIQAIGKVAWRRNNPNYVKGRVVDYCLVSGMTDGEILDKLVQIDANMQTNIKPASNKHLVYMHKRRVKVGGRSRRVKAWLFGEQPLRPDIDAFENYVKYLVQMPNPNEQLAFAIGLQKLKKLQAINALTRLLDPDVNELERQEIKNRIVRLGTS